MNIKNSYAGIALLSAIVLMFIGMLIDPKGVIDSTILYGTAQLLLFAATMLGFGQTVQKVTELINDFKNSLKEGNHGERIKKQ